MSQVEEFLEAKRKLERPIWASVLTWMAAGRVRGGRRKKMEGGQKKSLYFDAEVLFDLQREAKRTETSVSHLLRMAWGLAKEELKTYPEKP